MIGRWRSSARRLREFLQLPAAARDQRRRDRSGLPTFDPGNARVLDGLKGWLYRAQDESKSQDGGVARDYSLINGWATSYPETTGYIIPTLIDYGQRGGEADAMARARRMADWLVAIQLPCGGFQGGKIDSRPVVPVTFNTGQILLGLAAAEQAFGQYRAAMHRAADWLVKTQDVDGCWRKHPTPFATAGEKAYETHVAWGLFEAARIDPDRGYGEAGLANVRWALGLQSDDGWIRECSLDDVTNPLTHTIGYALRGILEAYRFSKDPTFLNAAKRTADALLGVQAAKGFLPGCLRSDWSAATSWICLTGTAQIAHCWLLMYQYTGKRLYAEAAFEGNRLVRRTVVFDGVPDVRGGVKGSFPVDGEYGRYEYLNWAAKFLADSLMLEEKVRCEIERTSGNGNCCDARAILVATPA
ncbi:MAG: prenyltransferase/squalene oxidase repeat-containing protein [Burkholderiales bacterium]